MRQLAYLNTTFTVVLLLFLSISGFFIVNTLRDVFVEYRQTSQQTLALNSVLEDILEARTAALKFRSVPTEHYVNEVTANLDDAINCVTSCDVFKDAAEYRDAFDRIAQKGVIYKKLFLETVTFQRQLDILVPEMSDAATHARQRLSEMMQSTESTNDIDAVIRAGHSIEALLLAHTYADRFLLTNEHSDYEHARVQLFDAMDQISALLAVLENPDKHWRVDEAQQSLGDYILAFESVHALIERLNTIRSAQLDVIGPDISARTESIAERVTQRQNRLGPLGNRTVEGAKFWIVINAIVAVIVGAALSLLLASKMSKAIVSMAEIMRRLAGGDLTVQIRGTENRHELGEIARALLVFKENAALARDVERSKRQQRELERYASALEAAKHSAEKAAFTDALTGLANRRHLDLQLKHHLEQSAPDDELQALHVDLDRFKQINDTFGHNAGDSVLKHVAATLESATREEDFVARVGGDEFVILCAPSSCERSVEGIADRIVAELAKPVEFEGRLCRFGASVGIATAPVAQARDLIVQADVALYHAKRSGRGRVARFSNELREQLVENKTLTDEIVTALEKRHFIPYFQPQFDAVTHDLVGIEALARWSHPIRGILGPGAFLRTAEEIKVVEQIDQAIFQAAFEFCRMAERAGVHIPKCAVNVSCDRLLDDAILDGLPNLSTTKTRFAFELLETIFFDSEAEAIHDRINQLRERNIEIEIDDFGSGRASVTGLMQVRPQRLKIDSMLIQPVVTSRTQRRLVESIIDMGRALKIEVTAEGVETLEHAHILRDMGCTTLQGYHFARPMDGASLMRFIAEEGWRPVPPMGERAA